MNIETVYKAMFKTALYKEPIPQTVNPTDSRILRVPSEDPTKYLASGLGIGSTGLLTGAGSALANHIGLLGATASGAIGVPAVAAGGFSLGRLIRSAGEQSVLDRTIDRSVKAQQSTLNLYDNKYKPWQDKFYRDKGYVQKPTGMTHPDTGKPVFQWVKPSK